MADATNSGARSRTDLDAWFSFIGYGDPKAPVWFIGIEEGGDQDSIGPDTSHEAWTFGKETLTHDGLPEGHNLVWDTARELMEQASAPGTPAAYFLSNIAPVPRRNISVQHHGLDQAAYKKRVITERVGRLRRIAESPDAPIMVFHGVAAWRGYRVLQQFELDEREVRSRNTGVPQGLMVVDRPRMILCPTFSWGRRHFADEQRLDVIKRLREWINR